MFLCLYFLITSAHAASPSLIPRASWGLQGSATGHDLKLWEMGLSFLGPYTPWGAVAEQDIVTIDHPLK